MGEKLGAGEGLLPTARIVWKPPGALMPVVDHLPGLRGCLGTLMPKVDDLPWPLQLPGLPLPMLLPNTNSPMW